MILLAVLGDGVADDDDDVEAYEDHMIEKGIAPKGSNPSAVFCSKRSWFWFIVPFALDTFDVGAFEF